VTAPGLACADGWEGGVEGGMIDALVCVDPELNRDAQGDRGVWCN